MRRLWMFCFFPFFSCIVIAQEKAGPTGRPPIDTSVFSQWPFVAKPVCISPNGQYVAYGIYNRPVGHRTIVLQSTGNGRHQEFENAMDIVFATDSKEAIILRDGDSLCILSLEKKETESIAHVKQFSLLNQGRKETLVYLLANPAKELVVRTLEKGRQMVYKGVAKYFTSDNNRIIVLAREADNDIANGSQELVWIDLLTGMEKTIWKGNRMLGNVIFDSSSLQLAFLVTATNSGKMNQENNEIWYYSNDAPASKRIVDDHSPGIDSSFQVDKGGTYWSFNQDGHGLVFTLRERPRPKAPSNTVQVDVWSYLDPVVQSHQLKEISILMGYAARIELATGRVLQLQQEGESISFGAYGVRPGNFAFIDHREGGERIEYKWNRTAVPYTFIEELNTGRRISIAIGSPDPFGFSQSGKFIVGLDQQRRDLLSCDVTTGKVVNLTKFLPIPQTDASNDYPGPRPRGIAIASWLGGDSALLVYDLYDIWLLDPAGRRTALNLTHGYGRLHGISFALTAPTVSNFKTPSGKPAILLSAVDTRNKDGGFYYQEMDSRIGPVELVMGPYHFYFPHLHPNLHVLRSGLAPLRARDTALWVVGRESAEISRNYFLTADFKKFSPLSGIYPEREYNWLTEELVTFRSLNGESLNGILYRPGNFDPQKKHPVLVHYYEWESSRLHEYLQPEPIEDNINIPWFVSQGYIVFTPDIHYTVGQPGPSAYNSVVGAALYLSKLPWVDRTKIGIQGHSFGGYETNFIVTHTNVFAAAMSSAGYCDMLSAYGSVSSADGTPAFQSSAESGQNRMGTTIWLHPEKYLLNSPLLKADRVVTPLLMMNNKLDGAVDFSQGVEFFIALRRMGKRVWMLQYDGETHGLANKQTALQHTLRVTQFFDHYLRGQRAPQWMTRGIPARNKGISDNLALDTMIASPPLGGLLLQQKAKKGTEAR